MNNLSSNFRKAFRFFCMNAGGFVGKQALGSIALARAEAWAQAQGWVAQWGWEEDFMYDTPKKWGWEARDIERWEFRIERQVTRLTDGFSYVRFVKVPREHTCEVCVLRDREGEILASIGGIWDASNAYRRVIEAELALEAMICTRRNLNESLSEL